MDFPAGKKVADFSKEQCLLLLSKPQLSKDEKLQLVMSAQTYAYIFSKISNGVMLARAYALAARAAIRVGEAQLAFWYAQYCEFLTKSSSDREPCDEALALELLGRGLELKGQVEEGQKCRMEALKIIEKVDAAHEINQFKKYLSEMDGASA